MSKIEATQCHVTWPKSNRIKDDVISYEVTLTCPADDNFEKVSITLTSGGPYLDDSMGTSAQAGVRRSK